MKKNQVIIQLGITDRHFEFTLKYYLSVGMEEPNKPMFLFQPGVDLREIVDAINQVGAPPSSLIAILEALKSAGSLRAELVVI